MNRVLGAFFAAFAFAVLIGFEIADAPSPRGVRGFTPADMPQAANEPHAVDRIPKWVTTILARPLFSPNRRPPADATAVAAADAGLPRLAGIMVGPSYRSAIFAAAGSKPIVVREGDHIGAYTIKSIESAEVALIGPEGKRRVNPSFDQDKQRPVHQPQGPGISSRTAQPK